jgi:hypothetical protein
LVVKAAPFNAFLTDPKAEHALSKEASGPFTRCQDFDVIASLHAFVVDNDASTSNRVQLILLTVIAEQRHRLV